MQNSVDRDRRIAVAIFRSPTVCIYSLFRLSRKFTDGAGCYYETERDGGHFVYDDEFDFPSLPNYRSLPCRSLCRRRDRSLPSRHRRYKGGLARAQHPQDNFAHGRDILQIRRICDEVQSTQKSGNLYKF